MKVKTSEIEGPALDWAAGRSIGMGVTLCNAFGRKVCILSEADHIKVNSEGSYAYSPSTNWSQGGPLIDQHEITVDPSRSGPWSAANGSGNWVEGDTPLIAACRAIVAAKLGDKVEVPDELL